MVRFTDPDREEDNFIDQIDADNREHQVRFTDPDDQHDDLIDEDGD